MDSGRPLPQHMVHSRGATHWVTAEGMRSIACCVTVRHFFFAWSLTRVTSPYLDRRGKVGMYHHVRYFEARQSHSSEHSDRAVPYLAFVKRFA